MTTNTFLALLMASSVLTGLFTEAGKKTLDTLELKFPSSNLLAGLVAVIVAALVCAAYTVIYEVPATDKTMVGYVALVLLSWLSAMVGYDKVIQALAQIGEA